MIAAAGAVLVAIISLAGKSWRENSLSPTTNKDKLTVKVFDEKNGKGIGNAKIFLEGSGVSISGTTDDNGIFHYNSDPKKELRLWVEAIGYGNSNQRFTPADIASAKDISLTPLPQPSPTATRIIPAPSSSIVPSGNRRLIVRGQVMDETGAVPGARVTIAGYGSATTDESGNFKIAISIAKGRAIDLHVAKEGYKTRTQEEVASDDSITILLRR